MIERQWREYRAAALAWNAQPAVVKAAKLAFYAGVSMALAELTQADDEDETICALVDELGAFADRVEPRRAAPR
jgi:hypothetical protein